MNLLATSSNCLPNLCNCPFYWRDTAMLTGLAVAITGIALAVFQGALFFATLFFLSTLTIGFGAYYVSRYAELAEMREQLTILEQTNTSLTNTATELDSELSDFRTQNDHLEKLNTSLHSSLGQARTEFQNFRNANKDLVRAQAQLKEYLDTLGKVSLQLKNRQKSLRKAMIDESRIRLRIKTEVKRLHRISRTVQTATTALSSRIAHIPIASNSLNIG